MALVILNFCFLSAEFNYIGNVACAFKRDAWLCELKLPLAGQERVTMRGAWVVDVRTKGGRYHAWGVRPFALLQILLRIFMKRYRVAEVLGSPRMTRKHVWMVKKRNSSYCVPLFHQTSSPCVRKIVYGSRN